MRPACQSVHRKVPTESVARLDETARREESLCRSAAAYDVLALGLKKQVPGHDEAASTRQATLVRKINR